MSMAEVNWLATNPGPAEAGPVISIAVPIVCLLTFGIWIMRRRRRL